jgi:hypothetical protein
MSTKELCNTLCQLSSEAQAKKRYPIDCRSFVCQQGFDIFRLFESLNKIKKRQLSDQEREYICLRLAAYSPQTIACYFLKHEIISMKDLKDEWSDEIEQKNKILKSEMSKTVHRYIKKLMEVEEDSRFSWPEFIDFLEANGYQETSHNTKTSNVLVEHEIDLDNNELIQLWQRFIEQNFLNIRIIDIE